MEWHSPQEGAVEVYVLSQDDDVAKLLSELVCGLLFGQVDVASVEQDQAGTHRRLDQGEIGIKHFVNLRENDIVLNSSE